MKEVIVKNKEFVYLVVVTFILLLLPLISMQFSKEISWTLFDFISAGVLTIVFGSVFILISRRLKSLNQKIVLALGVLGIFLLVWIQLSVGIFN